MPKFERILWFCQASIGFPLAAVALGRLFLGGGHGWSTQDFVLLALGLTFGVLIGARYKLD